MTAGVSSRLLAQLSLLVPAPRQHPDEVPVLDEAGIRQAVEKIAAEILEGDPAEDGRGLAFVGIERRGVPFADRVREACAASGREIVTGSLDISLYRDDFDNLGTVPTLRASRIGFDPTGRRVVLFDDVLFTGRTVRAALGALMDFGRPSCIRLAVLVDRGNRELPLQADYVGLRLPTHREDHVWVRFRGTDARDGVSVVRRGAVSRPD